MGGAGRAVFLREIMHLDDGAKMRRLAARLHTSPGAPRLKYFTLVMGRIGPIKIRKPQEHDGRSLVADGP